MKTTEPTPVISEHTALLCAVLYTACYVAPFYLSPTLRSTPLNSRDAPSVIRVRVRAVGWTCLVCAVLNVYILVGHGHAAFNDVLRLQGLWPFYPSDILKVLGLLCILFSGPLFESFIVDRDWQEWSFSGFKDTVLHDWITYRNLVIAPVSEEFVWRSLTVSVYLLARVPPTRIIVTTPLIFGLAHVHHLAEFLQSHTPLNRRWPPPPVWINGLIRTLFQLTYTSLFGMFAAFVLLRTGSIWAAIAAHTFCNWQGVPRLYGRVGRFALRSRRVNITPDVAQGKGDASDRDRDCTTSLDQGGYEPYEVGVVWTVVYYVLIVGGSVGFYKMLWPLTASTNALAQV